MQFAAGLFMYDKTENEGGYVFQWKVTLILSQNKFTCSKSIIQTLEKGVEYAQS